MKRRRFLSPFLGGLPDEVNQVLRRSAEALTDDGVPFVVVGGVGMAFQFPQYPTDDVDFAVPDEAMIPESLPGFKRLSKHMHEDKSTGVIVDFITAAHISIPQSVFNYAMDTAITHVDPDGFTVPVANILGLFAIKLSRGRIKDQAHIMWMMRHGFKPREEDLAQIGVLSDKIELYGRLRIELDREIVEEQEMGW